MEPPRGSTRYVRRSCAGRTGFRSCRAPGRRGPRSDGRNTCSSSSARRRSRTRRSSPACRDPAARPTALVEREQVAGVVLNAGVGDVRRHAQRVPERAARPLLSVVAHHRLVGRTFGEDPGSLIGSDGLARRLGGRRPRARRGSSDMTPERPRWVVVARVDRPDVVPALRRSFAGSPWVDVVLDRRRGERRQGGSPPAADRRVAGRRTSDQHPAQVPAFRLAHRGRAASTSSRPPGRSRGSVPSAGRW